MRSFRSGRLGLSPDPAGPVDPEALPALRRATRLFGLALGSALGRLRESGATAARLFARAEESALLLRMAREAAEILGARWDKVPERVGAQWELPGASPLEGEVLPSGSNGFVRPDAHSVWEG